MSAGRQLHTTKQLQDAVGPFGAEYGKDWANSIASR